jgi:fructoselysine-6-P-deglycase FrlB-like protein
MTQRKPMAEQLENEPTQDYIKFLVFLGMGSSRSLNKAYKQYYETTNEVSEAWRTLAGKYRWAERASEHDKVCRT